MAGYPMQDIRCTVYDGKYHPVDSKEVAFVAAGRKAFRDAVQKAAPVLLEPVGDVEVVTPEEFVGAITGDLSQHRAQITGTDVTVDGNTVIFAKSPLAELQNIEARLRALTGGRSSHRITFSHYEPAAPNIQAKLISEFKHEAED